MDCHQAQAQLDLTTLGRQAATGPEALAAQRHLAECDACHLAVESQQRFDAQVAQAMTDVPLPAGLNERLSAAVSAANVLPESTLRPLTTGTGPMSRRRMVRTLGWGAIAALVPLLMWGLLAPRVPTLNEASVRELAGLNLDFLPVDLQRAAFSPAGWSTLRAIQFGDAPRRASVHGADVPVMAFLLQTDRRSPRATGLLVRLPQSQWHATPDTTSFSSATIQYESFGTWVVWLEGNEVFVCILHDNAHAMQRLQELIAGSRELT